MVKGGKRERNWPKGEKKKTWLKRKEGHLNEDVSWMQERERISGRHSSQCATKLENEN